MRNRWKNQVVVAVVSRERSIFVGRQTNKHTHTHTHTGTLLLARSKAKQRKVQYLLACT